MEDQEKKECPNCQQMVFASNLTTHTLHCTLRLTRCPDCQEVVSREQLTDHREQQHGQVRCECGQKVRKDQLEQHKRVECPVSEIACPLCDLPVHRRRLRDHEDKCGSETELCPICGKYILRRLWADHPLTCRGSTLQSDGPTASPQWGSPPHSPNEDVWDAVGRRFSPLEDPMAAVRLNDDDVLLPCEFCGQVVEGGDALVIHQSLHVQHFEGPPAAEGRGQPSWLARRDASPPFGRRGPAPQQPLAAAVPVRPRRQSSPPPLAAADPYLHEMLQDPRFSEADVHDYLERKTSTRH